MRRAGDSHAHFGSTEAAWQITGSREDVALLQDYYNFFVVVVLNWKWLR